MSQKPYYTFGQYLKNRFGERVHKVAIDAGFTCPNLDGRKGTGGCTYCNNEGFSFNSRREVMPIPEQISKGIAFMEKRFKARKFMAYFQAFSNTYAPVPHLKEIYDQIIPFGDKFVAFAVGTRPDAISRHTLYLLESYSDRYEVWMEYGLQSSHDRTLQRINRCDSYQRFLWAVDKTRLHNLKICVHVILGLPGETHADMMETADRLAELPIHSLKVHLLHIMRNTQMEYEYAQGLIPMFTLDEYVQTCVDFVERIPSHISIQRLTADAPPSLLIAPDWCMDRRTIYERIEQEFKHRGTLQGSRVDPCMNMQCAQSNPI